MEHVLHRLKLYQRGISKEIHSLVRHGTDIKRVNTYSKTSKYEMNKEINVSLSNTIRACTATPTHEANAEIEDNH